MQTEPAAPPAAVHALALVPGGDTPRIISASQALEGRAPSHTVRRTAGGAELLVQGRVVAALAADAPKFRIPVSAPPDRRDPFRR